MGITYSEKNKVFKLDTKNTSYLTGITAEGYVGHIYYGRKLKGTDCGYLLRTDEPPFGPSINDRDKTRFLDSLPLEYPTGGIGDFRESCLDVTNEYGQTGCELFFRSFKILEDKPSLEGLPSTFFSKEDVGDAEYKTLVLTLWDDILKLEVKLFYSVFYNEDVITRWAVIKNDSNRKLVIEKAYSACIDMDNRNFETLTLYGSWARERQIERKALLHGKQMVSSIRGETSQQANAFMALLSENADQKNGEVYAANLVYSGNFKAQTELAQWNNVRMTLGINNEFFAWNLEPGQKFTTPECVLTYSYSGLTGMTHSFHDLYRGHLIRSGFLNKERPVLINNWEATYFDFNSDKLLEIARQAKDAGIEMLVMDDGWFGHRNNDESSLGDWYVNESKITGGLVQLSEKIHELGLKFGIWFEPEMISEDSELYEEHPDWAIRITGRRPAFERKQLVLDLSRPEVREYCYSCVHDIIRDASIDYVKWDMNRSLCDLGSTFLPEDAQKELSHRYVLGLYELQERLVSDFPELLLENCSAGGARFDPGMLYYSPQIWCSDDMDVKERLGIQEGTALIYPLSSIGAHVCAVPNHTTGRVVPFDTRADVAMAGTFGYELDITKLPEDEKDRIRSQVELYHRLHHIVSEGDYYRLSSYSQKEPIDAYGSVLKDKSEALFTYVQVFAQANVHSCHFCFDGLDPNADYKVEVIKGGKTVENEGGIFGGDSLMYAGILVLPEPGDYKSKLYHLVRV